MRVLFEEKTKVLVERNGWSLAYARGFVDGEIFRRRSMTPSQYAKIGIDEYSLGFRAGYYDRSKPGPASFGRPQYSSQDPGERRQIVNVRRLDGR